jgi:polygalacturonase
MNLRRDLFKTAGVALLAKPFYAATPARPLQGFGVKEFGAAGDGKTIDTPAINWAIDAVAAAGGGTVLFPSGQYLSYSIHLKSNVTLYLETGAKIIAADGDSYDKAESNAPWEAYQDDGHNHWHNSLIWGEGLDNVAILGPGLIWGRGLSKGYGPGPTAEAPGVGNKAIALKNCRNVLLRDFSILHGGHFGILATGVDNLTIDNLKIDTNRDGMDIDCCRNVRVSNCAVNSPWDDGICLKGSYALGEPRSTDLVAITNCFVAGSYAEGSLLDATLKPLPATEEADRTGRIKFSTESNGGFRNITVSNCVFHACQGIALESSDGALLEDVAFTNIAMRDIVTPPLFFRLNRRMRGPEGRAVGTLKRILIANLVCSNAESKWSSVLSGVPGHSIEDVKIDNVYIQHRGGGSRAEAEVPEQETDYPDPNKFPAMPSSGFFIRHVKNIEMSNVEITGLEPDARPTIVLNDVAGADFFRIKAPCASSVPLFAMSNVTDFGVDRTRSVADTVLERVDRQTL